MNPSPSPHGNGTRTPVADAQVIKAELAARLDSLVAELYGDSAKRYRNEYRLGSVRGERGSSLTIKRAGTNAGLWHDFNPSGSGSGDLITLIELRLNLTFKEALAWAQNWLGRPAVAAAPPAAPPVPGDAPRASGEKLRPANNEFLAKRLKRLRDNPAAVAWLEGRGITPETAARFHLGLSTPYTDRDGTVRQDALVAPVIGADGVPLNKTAYYNIPGLTLNPTDKNGWMKGEPLTYYADEATGRPDVFVCEGLKDLWRTWQALRGSELASRVVLISSTHGSAIPEEWKQPAFWDRFSLVFLGHDSDAAGDLIARNIAAVAGHEVLRVRPPKERGKDWTDFWQRGGTAAEFEGLLAEAGVVSQQIGEDTGDEEQLGRLAYRPVDIATAFHRGCLYYPVQTLVRGTEMARDEEGREVPRIVEQLETVVVRSDRTVHSLVQSPAPKGVKPEHRVLRLTDGTLIEAAPKASTHATWSWSSIKAYLGGGARTRPLAAVLSDIDAHLRRSVWLPYDEDYALLSLLVPVTYAQAVFQSVPMVLVVGAPGSGKSALGRAMARVCANATVIGQTSAAAVARHIHDTKGFVVMDDLESIGGRGGKDSPQFGELVQALKLSYNKESSWKYWTDVSRGMKIERLNFFGVKMINNTTGADNILGSRMLRVQTRPMPDSLKSLLGVTEFGDVSRLSALRDELHAWTFENVALIDDTYKRLFPKPTDRGAEISAPLRVFAEIAGDEVVASALDRALDRRRHSPLDQEDPVEIMKEAMKRLVRDGYQEVATTHVVLEMKTLIDENFDRRLTNEVAKWEDPAWVGRQLRTHDLIDTNSAAERQWLFGKCLRIYPIKDYFLVEVLKDHQPPGWEGVKRDPVDFCGGCATCRYRNAGCPIMEGRLADEKKKGVLRTQKGGETAH